MRENDLLIVNEIFFSIQGESSHAGKTCAFVRLTYCNLRCTYCDTEYAFYEGKGLSVDEIINRINQFPTELVEITGGEPLLQKNVHKLIRRLLDSGKTVLIETGGSLDIKVVDPRAILIYDIKCPDSGMHAQNLWRNLNFLKTSDEVKFVISSRSDYQWARDILRQYQLDAKHTVLFSPVWGKLSPKELADWILHDGLRVRLQLQLHKLVWGAEARGV
ncbi:MAG: radical SAM protein [Acidobacteria bacterium]|nr:radical SAM protein [Acidobacteriota bacterium]